MNLINEDNVVQVFLHKLGDIVIANLLFILCCIPVITIGPSQHFSELLSKASNSH